MRATIGECFMRVLFTTQVGSGHWRPLVPFAHALAAAGHAVAFAATPIFCDIIRGHGFRCFPAGTDDWIAALDMELPDAVPPAIPPQSAWVMRHEFIPRAARRLPDLLAIARTWAPHLIVREHTEYAGGVVAECIGVPCATMQVSFFRPHLDREIVSPLNQLRAAAGLAPNSDPAMLYRDLLLLPFPPCYADPTSSIPATARFVRHVAYDIERPKATALPAWIHRLLARPTVYATLGTAYNRTPGIFAAILAALREEAINLIVTLGPKIDPAMLGPQPPHVHIEPYLPQSVLFPRCDLVLTHGGSGTVRTAIAFGIPMVILPIAADQPDNARRCNELGIADVLAADGRTPTAIRAAVRRVLTTPRYRENSQRISEEMRALPGPERAGEWLERLVEEWRLSGADQGRAT